MGEFLDFLGSVSNAVAAGCAVYALVVTHRQYEKTKQDEKDRKISEKKDVLFKESVIDYFVYNIMKDISDINKEIIQLKQKGNFESDDLKAIYDRLRVESQVWLYEIEILKFFDNKLYIEVKKKMQDLIDIYSQIINKSVKDNRIPLSFSADINKQLTVIKTMLYKEYIKML